MLSQQPDPLSSFEEKARLKGYCRIAGVDEAGRGPIAGPVVAAACILPPGTILEGIDDSKKLSPKERQRLYRRIMDDPTIYKEIGMIEAVIIDQINILRATLQAMALAIAKIRADYILVDGRDFPPCQLPGEAIIRGDSLSQSIMAGAILAKETRDQLMREMDDMWPLYGFAIHKGYGTEAHLQALKKHGPCPIHRLSFEPVKSWVAP